MTLVLSQNLDRHPVYAYVVEFTTYGIFISKSGWRFVSFEARAKLFGMLLACMISANFA